MTLQARAAQRSMATEGVDPSGPLGRSVGDLAQLTRGALAEMRALIFELRPAALVEEGLVAALGKRAAALSAREGVAITIEGPEDRLGLSAESEEHLYRIVSQAIHNAVKHAGAVSTTITVTARAGLVQAVVSHEGVGVNLDTDRAAHHGLSDMAERSDLIGADLMVTSAPGTGTTVTVSLMQDGNEHGKAVRPSG
jgi:signal transduction histidine kinase